MYPDIIYKYRYWDDDFHKRLLTDNKIFFASPILFNDPFDCTVPVRFDNASEEHKKK